MGRLLSRAGGRTMSVFVSVVLSPVKLRVLFRLNRLAKPIRAAKFLGVFICTFAKAGFAASGVRFLVATKLI